MSIVLDLLKGKITWDTAEAEIEGWGAKIVSNFENDPAVVAATGGVVSDLKQAASDALSTADTLAGPIIAAAAETMSAAITAAATAYLGPFGANASAAAHDAIQKIGDGVKAEVDAVIAQLQSQLKAPPPVPLSQAPNVLAVQDQIDQNRQGAQAGG